MKKVMLVFGTRPEAIKMCPLVKELKKRKELSVTVCVTGQHKEMLKQVLDVFDVIPDYDLAIMQERQTLFDVTANILNRIGSVLDQEQPELVLVHGDTTTTFATALACFYKKIAVGHVEAGLRTYDLSAPYPEEFNRQAVSILAAYDFAPTERSRQNLLKEGRDKAHIFVTGNTAIDALKTTVREDYQHPVLTWAKGYQLIVLTAHRRENLGEPLLQMFRAVRRILHERMRLIEPMNVADFHNLLARSYLILTDSGGIQEEAPSLGKPVLVMRNTTERPEGVEAGTLLVVGTEEESIYSNFNRLLKDKNLYRKMSTASNPYGDGKACERIADIICWNRQENDNGGKADEYRTSGTGMDFGCMQPDLP